MSLWVPFHLGSPSSTVTQPGRAAAAPPPGKGEALGVEMDVRDPPPGPPSDAEDSPEEEGSEPRGGLGSYEENAEEEPFGEGPFKPLHRGGVSGIGSSPGVDLTPTLARS